jgi:signal transduction histidine kinase
MTFRPVAPTRLRRRLAIAFVLAVAFATGVLAVGSYLIVEHARIKDATDRAVSDSVLNLRFARQQAAPPVELFQAFRERGQFATVILGPGGVAQSATIGPAQLPEGVRRLVSAGQVADAWITLGSTHYIVVGGRVPGSGSQYFFFYNEQQVWDDLQTLRYVLPAGWIAMVVLAALGGTLLSRRTLAPVAQASDAANALADGLLDTRLPVASDDEFGAWAASFNEMASALQTKIDELAEAQAREQRFTANVAHELLTPLTAIVGETRLLASQGDTLTPKARRLAEALVRDVARLRRLTEDLLEISRLDAGSEPTVTEPVDVSAAIRGIVRDGEWGDQVHVSPGEVVVSTDPRRLQRILANLIANALTHGATRVDVRLVQHEDYVLVVVADDGPGIDPAALPRVFERFFKDDPSRGSAGSGLGLAIARENARLLGGDVTATSQIGSGAVFTLRLPVAKPFPGGVDPVAGNIDPPTVGE